MLVQEDMGVDAKGARRILKESNEIGNLLNLGIVTILVNNVAIGTYLLGDSLNIFALAGSTHNLVVI
ncbi:hypothetical protein ACJ73_09973 [Blastomyces percursus]|uniref:Restriction of telomere capping protein 4 C-terminal domain-containing protein n=1 Tax=Blastomyces percursus TaxID=1658174 RepID=A0A1J9Q186_9EURO|nr:hypothetical protein ACJ73_09973 [Blastomyces percursus]